MGYVTECALIDGRCGFRRDGRRVDHVFSVGQVCVKYLMNRKDVFCAFVVLEKGL